MAKQRVVVTGGAGQLGRCIATALAEDGAKVAALDLAEADIPGVRLVKCDLGDEQAVDAALSDVEPWLGGTPTVLVNAVGLIHSAPLLNPTRADRRHALSDWDRVIRANLTAVFVPTSAVVDRMFATRTRGVVISLSSIAANGNPGQGAYAAAKAGVTAAMNSWARELGPLGLRFVTIAPGFIGTSSTQAALSETQLADLRRRTPLRTLGAAEDVARAVSYAISAPFLTGTVIAIDGGLTL